MSTPDPFVRNVYDTADTATVDAHVVGLVGTGATFSTPLILSGGNVTFGGLTAIAANDLFYASSTSAVARLATVNTAALVTSSLGAPSWASGGTANRVLRTDGTSVTFSQIALATDVTGILGATNGGTGQSTVTTGDILYGSASNVWSKLAGVATGNALISGGVATAPTWGKIGLTTHVSGTLGVGNGGTGVATFGGTNRLLYTTATDTLSSIATANTSSLVTSNTGVPSWTSGGTANRLLRTDGTTVSFAQAVLTTDVTGTLPATNGGTGVGTLGGTNTLLFTTTANNLSSITTANTSALVTSNTGVPSLTSGGTANRVLRTDGTTVSFAQVALSTDVTGTLGATNGGTGQSAVTTGDLLYGSASNTWSRLAGAATGNALISGGVTTAPAWGKIGLTTHVTGTLAVTNGGTGLATIGANGIMFGQGTSNVGTSSNLTWNNSNMQMTVTNSSSKIALSVFGAGNGGSATLGHLAWYEQSSGTIMGMLSSGDGNEGQFYIFGDSNVSQYIGECDFMDRSIVGDKRCGGFQMQQTGGSYQLYIFAFRNYFLIGRDDGSAYVISSFGIGNVDPSGNGMQLYIQNNTTYWLSVSGGDNTSTPSNSVTPFGWLFTQVDGTDSWIPYYQ